MYAYVSTYFYYLCICSLLFFLVDRAAASTSISGPGGGLMNDSGMTGGSAGGINPHPSSTGEDGVGGVSAASIESVKGGEMLMDALDLVHTELAAIAERAANTTTTTKHRCASYSVYHILCMLSLHIATHRLVM